MKVISTQVDLIVDVRKAIEEPKEKVSMKGAKNDPAGVKPETLWGFFKLPAVLLGISFLVIFSGFSTLENMQKTLLASVRDEQPDFKGDGYTSLGILYSVFAISIWFSPSIISVTGPVLAMVIGASGYVLFPISFILESTSYLYFGAFMNGIGSSLLWTGQANYLILHSRPGMVSKNVGLFWIFYMMGMLPGNLIVFFAFKDKRKHIDARTRVFILSVLSAMMGVGVLIMYFLRRPKQRRRTPPGINSPLAGAHVTPPDVILSTRGPGRAFRTALRLCVTRPMLWLMLPFCYAGLHLTFFSSVYSASVGFTLRMGQSTKQLVPLAGILTGVGEITGGILPFVLHNRKLCGLNLIMLTGIISNLGSYAMTYINIPDVAAFGNTWESSLIPPNEYVACLCSFLMGLGDCCVHTELYSILGTLYPNESAEVFAVFKFVRCLCTAADFYCSPFIGLHIQLSIQTIAALLCLACYIVVQHRIIKPPHRSLSGRSHPSTGDLTFKPEVIYKEESGVTYGAKTREVTYNNESSGVTYGKKLREVTYNNESSGVTYGKKLREVTYNEKSGGVTHKEKSGEVTYDGRPREKFTCDSSREVTYGAKPRGEVTFSHNFYSSPKSHTSGDETVRVVSSRRNSTENHEQDRESSIGTKLHIENFIYK